MTTHSLVSYYQQVDDPRQQSKCQYNLEEVLFMVTSAILCGAEDWEMITEFCHAREAWLKKFISLENGIPSHDTFNRIFSIICSDQLQSMFTLWMSDIMGAAQLSGQISIDGKALRGSAWEKGKSPTYMVNAWSSKLSMSIGHVKVSNKSNEITAVPKLLDLLEVEGCLISLDAMGTQTTIANKIIEKKGDYLLAVKGNQKLLHQELINYFDNVLETKKDEDNENFSSTENNGHGRLEHRRCWVSSDVSALPLASIWKAKTVILIQNDRKEGKTCESNVHYYISSRTLSAEDAMAYVRNHWHVENHLHWTLDVAFDEDKCRARAGNSAQNLATIRQIILNLLKKNTSKKLGIKNRRKLCGYSDEYLLRTLSMI